MKLVHVCSIIYFYYFLYYTLFLILQDNLFLDLLFLRTDFGFNYTQYFYFDVHNILNLPIIVANSMLRHLN